MNVVFCDLCGLPIKEQPRWTLRRLIREKFVVDLVTAEVDVEVGPERLGEADLCSPCLIKLLAATARDVQSDPRPLKGDTE